ncbi:uncharacterized protein PG986_010911 [Apiospora aurea]|uniref:WDR59/RTC1-like RING zinc finger domain-containing protein n=1 Tax=Apiospora aurea TaxID=335848 RepID=A0ABR1Q3L4_9PEZI
MPSLLDPSKKGKTIKSAADSETFDADVTIRVEGLVGSATISPSGRDIALASCPMVALAARDYWVASTANHRCLIWNLNLREASANGAIEHSLRGHSRAITDINFSAHHPDILATCAVDGYVHGWDLRRPRQPVQTYCDWFAGATQVKYNRQDPFVLASSHDRWLHIWDERKPSEPLKSINAHTSKIYGLDWNRTRSTALVTCSLDRSIKFWDYGVSDEPERIIRTDFPVWRARHTPFGSGLLAMPQSDPGNLYLYNTRRGEDEPRDHHADPVTIFAGHGSQKAKEFLWRGRGNITDDGIDNREFQLVSWGEDNELHLNRVDPGILESVGHVKGGAASRSGSLPSWRGPSMKAKTSVGKAANRSLDQLGWMKGITMSRKKSSTREVPQRKESKDSAMFGSGFHGHWEEPEPLQEEIVRISQQLPNVQWDKIDLTGLILDASLKGPWGADGETIYIKVRVDVPSSYPKSRAPKFLIEKSALMSEQTYKKIDQEVNQVAYRFAKKKQNCLEVAFTYLLGETDLSSSTNFFKNVRDFDDELDPLADESSSEDEADEIPAGELDATLAPINRPTLPPIPRLCGGRWSNDGRLVCFFPSKEEKAKALLFTPTDTFKERPKGEPTFAGFGRLQQETPPPRQRHLLDESSMAGDHSDSEEADDSSSSSDSEETYMHKVSMWYTPGRRLRKTFSGSYSMRSSGGGTGVDTGTGTGTSRRRSTKPKNVVSLHDMSDLLPSKQELAQEYCIFGDGPEVCEHNADVALKYGRYDLVQVWRYAALLLRRDIPLELLEQTPRNSSVLVVAKNIINHVKDGKTIPGNPENHLAGKVKWGLHPLAKGFIADLFDYFEQAADVQMLAMLSCVFSEASTKDGVAYAESHMTQPETPLGMKAPSFSLDYFPTDASLWHTSSNYKSHVNSAVSTPGTVHTPVHIPGSYGSEEGYWLGDPGSNSYPSGGTPPPPKTTPRDSMSDADVTQSLSTSPDPRLFRRGNTALSTGFAASFPRPFTNLVSSSPPTKKRPSPGEAILANLTPQSRNSYSDDEQRKDEIQLSVINSISVEIEDQSIFDDDGWMTTPLLEPSRETAYSTYRYAYAEMLHMWNHPLARLEIMKFNVLKEDPSTSHFDSFGQESFRSAYHSPDSTSHTTLVHQGTASPIVLAKKEHLQGVLSSGRGLDVVGYCRIHETQLDPIGSTYGVAAPGGAVGTCERCKRMQTRLFCVYCLGPLDAQYVPCLGCGCALHEACLAEWHSMGETECPAGDECNCAEEACNGQVERWAAMVGALRQGKLRKPSEDLDNNAATATASGEGGRHRRANSIDKNDWESVESGSQLPAADGQGKPLLNVDSQPTLSAARISLGNRLRKSAGQWGSSASLRKKAGPGGSGGPGSSGLSRR